MKERIFDKKACGNKKCQALFTPTSNNHLFCSRECREPTMKKRVKVYQEKNKSFRQECKEKAVFVKKPCLCCEKFFLAEGKFNRVCLRCKKEERYGSQNENIYSINGVGRAGVKSKG